MKKTIIILTAILFLFSVRISSKEDSVYLLAEIIAGEMGDEPFTVRVAYGEMLLNGGKAGTRRAAPRRSDMRAAAAALCNYGFSGDAANAARRGKVKNTPLEMRSGVWIYDWFFYM